MSITDEDLQFMADDMWKDALLPDLPSMYGFGDQVDSAAAVSSPGDRLLDLPSEGKGDTGGDDSKSGKDGGSSALKKTTPATKPVKSAKGKGKGRGKDKGKEKSKEKGKEAVLASPLTDLYLSTPALVRPKKEGKLSKSMKGASQNESQQDGLRRLPKPHKTVRLSALVQCLYLVLLIHTLAA